MGVEGEGKEGGDERREGVVPAGPRRRLRPRGLLSLPIRRGVRGGGFILVRDARRKFLQSRNSSGRCVSPVFRCVDSAAMRCS